MIPEDVRSLWTALVWLAVRGACEAVQRPPSPVMPHPPLPRVAPRDVAGWLADTGGGTYTWLSDGTMHLTCPQRSAVSWVAMHVTAGYGGPRWSCSCFRCCVARYLDDNMAGFYVIDRPGASLRPDPSADYSNRAMTPPLGQGLYPGDMGTISDNPDAIKAWLKDAQAKMSDMVARWQERADQAAGGPHEPPPPGARIGLGASRTPDFGGDDVDAMLKYLADLPDIIDLDREDNDA